MVNMCALIVPYSVASGCAMLNHILMTVVYMRLFHVQARSTILCIRLVLHTQSCTPSHTHTHTQTDTHHIPDTSKSRDSVFFRPLVSLYGMASHGISPKYSIMDSSSRSELAKMISKFLLAAFSFLYASTSWGVNPLHGPH